MGGFKGARVSWLVLGKYRRSVDPFGVWEEEGRLKRKERESTLGF